MLRKVCENTELPRKQLSTKCPHVISNLGTYQPGDQIDCDNGFLCLHYQQMGPTTCYTLLMVNTSQLQCYNNYNCKLVSTTIGNINYQLQCEAYGTINPTTDCKCDQSDLCQMPIYQFNNDCNNDYRCTQPIFDQKCTIKVEECYTIDAERGFYTFDQTLVTTYNQVTHCNSSDPTCASDQVNQLLKNVSIWYQSDDFSDWRYDEFNPSKGDNITMICFGTIILTIYLCAFVWFCVYECVYECGCCKRQYNYNN